MYLLQNIMTWGHGGYWPNLDKMSITVKLSKSGQIGCISRTTVSLKSEVGTKVAPTSMVSHKWYQVQRSKVMDSRIENKVKF